MEMLLIVTGAIGWSLLFVRIVVRIGYLGMRR